MGKRSGDDVIKGVKTKIAKMGSGVSDSSQRMTMLGNGEKKLGGILGSL